MAWDYRDQHATVGAARTVNADDRRRARQASAPTTSTTRPGSAMRKVTEQANGTLNEERIYLGGFEIYRSTAADGATPRRWSARRCTSWTTSSASPWWRRAPTAATTARRAADPLPVRQPPRLGQPGAGRAGADHLLRGVLPLRQHVLSGGAQPDRDAEAIPLHRQGAGRGDRPLLPRPAATTRPGWAAGSTPIRPRWATG